MCKVAESPKKLHILAADDTGTAEKNIINKDLGILDDFGILVEYNGSGTKDDKIPHILFHAPQGDKTIYVLGYGNKKKWKKALGGQYGCLYIDEVNTADIDFVREASMRCDYLMATLNPDDPTLDVYKEYINCSRPLPEWADSTPQEIKDELREEPKPGWVHWFFSFDDNAGLPEEKKQQIIQNTPKGTKIWKNKIQGLRGKATGLIFPNFSRKQHVVSEKWIKAQMVAGKLKFKKFTCGLDTSYSSKSPDTIAMIFQGITEDRRLITLAEKVYSNKDLDQPLAPSDTAVKFIEFLENDQVEDWNERMLIPYMVAAIQQLYPEHGHGILNEDGKCIILLNAIESQYYITLTKYGKGDLYISKKDRNSFIVTGTPDLEFDWQVTAA